MPKSNASIVGRLDDSCFVDAGDLLSELCRQIEEAAGEKPSLQDFCDVLTLSLNTSGEDLFSDVDPAAIKSLSPRVSRRGKLSLKPGDVFAVPRPKGGFYVVIYILSSQLGDAFGVFLGHQPSAVIEPGWRPKPLKYPSFTGREAIAERRWRRLGTRRDLLKQFPASPEYVHAKEDFVDDDDIGPFGSGSDTEGRLRSLTKAEAKAIGLLDGTYRQVMVEEQFEEHLAERLR